MNLNMEVIEEIEKRGISHIVHFTQSRNFKSILNDGELRSVASLADDKFKSYSESDSIRADGHPDKLSVSIQYPNAYYLNKARPRAEGFEDWIMLVLEPQVLAFEGTLFCPYNAAKSGVPRQPGGEGLKACYAQSIDSGGPRAFCRGVQHDPRCPTDLQAEALVPAPIPIEYIKGVVVPSDEDALQEQGRLRLLHADPDQLRWYVAPGMFDVGTVRLAAQNGRRITGKEYIRGGLA
ncbi:MULTISPECIES: DarT ssDNA thymidine ADP-ribosyltransferase family protein [unclassified Leucobacter]|uniref:DarT ssDNA thymidine ADP-ribosyltransferase family protein n=1 Tax=unclassified Leucobacter TaxID=2621730 RepID=UPI003016A627